MSKQKTRKVTAAPAAAYPPKESFYKTLEAALIKKQKQILIALISFAVLFRIVYFIQLNNGPCIWQHRFEQSDMHFYDAWAKLIANGDWLSNRSFHQFDAPYVWIAEYYFKTHPQQAIELQKQLGNDKSPDALKRLLWKRWDGGKIYHQDPLYIYMVAVIYKIFGADVRYVFVLQMLIGIGTLLLIYFITHKHFGVLAATVSGFLACFCGPLIFYELVLVRESVIVFAGLLLVFLLDKTFEHTSLKKFFWLGVTLAFCILLKSTFIVFLFLTIALLFFIFRKELKLFLRFSAILFGGALIAYSPLLIRNSIVGVPLMAQNCIGAISVIASNDVTYNPEESYEFNLQHATEIMEKSNGKMMPAFIYTIETHPTIFSFITLLAKKAALVFHWYEFPNNKNFYYFRMHAPVLWFTFVNLLIIAPLAIAGIVLAIMQKKKLWSLYLLLIMHFVLLVAFIVMSRYRIPFEAALIPFAGFAVAELIKKIKVNGKQSAFTISIIVVSAIFVGRPLPGAITFIRAVDYEQPYKFYYKKIIDDKIKSGDIKGAVQVMKSFMAMEPDEVKKLNAGSTLSNYQLDLARVYANFHRVYASLCEQAGDAQLSVEENNRAQMLTQLSLENDRSGSVASLVAKAQHAEGVDRENYYRQAIPALQQQIVINPNDVNSYQILNEAYQNINQPDSAIDVLKKILSIEDNNYYALFQLGTVYGRYKNDMSNSILYLEKARILKPESEDVLVNLGIVYSMTGEKQKAIEVMQKVATINPNNKNNLNNLEMLLKK